MAELYTRSASLRSLDHLERQADPVPRNKVGEIPAEAAAGVQMGIALSSLRRHWAMVATTTLGVFALAVVYLATATPEYTATGLLLIDTKSNTALRANAPALTDANVESANIESQVELLKSERIMQRVIESENLVDSPALAPGLVARSIASLKGLIPLGRPVQTGENPKIVSAARSLQKLTSAKRLGLTYVVEISATMPDPKDAARVANAYAKAFIEDQTRLREETSLRMSTLLQGRTDELQAQAQKAERAVEQLKFTSSVEGETSASARVTLKNLESSAQAYRLLHDKFLERYAETWQQQFLSLPDAQIASPASAPDSKSAPKTLVILSASLLIGVALGLIRVILRDRRAIGL